MLSRKLKKVITPTYNGPLRSAGGDFLRPIGQCTLRVHVGNRVLPFEFLVLETCVNDIILGWDFLQYAGIKVDCLNEELHIFEEYPKKITDEECSNLDAIRIVVPAEVIVPASSFKTIRATTESGHEMNEGIVEPNSSSLGQRRLIIPRSYCSIVNDTIYLWIGNLSAEPQLIPAGLCVGLFYSSSTDTINTIVVEEKETINSSSSKNSKTISWMEDMINSSLDESQKLEISTLIQKFASCFAFHADQVGRTQLAHHIIDTGNSRPIKQRPYRVSKYERNVIDQQVEEMQKNNIIQPSKSPWASPVVLVKKKDGSWRFCVDYRKVNSVTKKDVYPLPRIDDALDSLSGSKYFSSLDLRSGYWQIGIKESDCEKTAFITPNGLFEFRVLPFGLSNAPATFERMMDALLHGLKWKYCLVYLDDVVVFSKNFHDHLLRLNMVLSCIQTAGLTLNPKKCNFGAKQLHILGHLVDEKGVQPDPGKLEAVNNFPTPQNVTQVRSFLGLCSYYRRFIKDFSSTAYSITELTQKNVPFKWSSVQETAFLKLKRALTSAPVLTHYSESSPTELHTDASNLGLGAVLVQKPDGLEHVIAYASRTLSKAELNYSTTEKECLAVTWAIKKFRPYLFGRQFTVVTDHHALCWLSNIKDPSGRLARWALRLQEFDITICYKSGKTHMDADCLSRNPVILDGETFDEDTTLATLENVDMAIEQSKDNVCTKIFAFIRNLTGSSKKRNNKYKNFQIENGVLYKKNYNPIGNRWLIVLPASLKMEVLFKLHDDPISGHFGIYRTWDRVRNRFFWPGMHKDVVSYVNSCIDCQRRKKSSLSPAGLLQPIPPATSPFERVGIDLLGRFPKSQTGNKWIIVCLDYMTRYAETKATPSGSAQEIAQFFVERIVLRHGSPLQLISDRGAAFLSKICSEVMDISGTSHLKTTSYHPQTNGLTERFNKTLGDLLSMYTNCQQTDWDEVLPYVTYAYNTACQETTKFSPFFLVYGREARTTLDTMMPYRTNEQLEDYSTLVTCRAEEARQLSRHRTLVSQTYDKNRYDSRHRELTFNSGDLVWVWTPIRRVGLSEKLLKRYFGPYKIIRQTSPVNYHVEPLSPKTKRKRSAEIVHVSRIKPYIERIEKEVTSASEIAIDEVEDRQKPQRLGPITRSMTIRE